MQTDNTPLRAQSPAALAEEYIVRSIWDDVFPAGTNLPSERDLADKIGVTRTTLREVLQRLAHVMAGLPFNMANRQKSMIFGIQQVQASLKL